MPQSFITLWKSAFNKCFINQSSGVARWISTGLCLGNWVDQDVREKWIWWLVERIYQRTGETWSYYSQRRRHYYLDKETDTYPLDQALPISVSTASNSFKIKRPATEFISLPPFNALSDFVNKSAWSTLIKGFDNAINNLTILLDKFIPSEDMCNNLDKGIQNGTPIGPAGTLFDILAPSTECHQKYLTKGCNWVTCPKASQSAYRSELAGVILSLTILNILVKHHNITIGVVTITLDSNIAMDKSRKDWPLSINQKCFDYLQVIWAWIKLSPLTFHSVISKDIKLIKLNTIS